MSSNIRKKSKVSIILNTSTFKYVTTENIKLVKHYRKLIIVEHFKKIVGYGYENVVSILTNFFE